jgi:hypothetical protein
MVMQSSGYIPQTSSLVYHICRPFSLESSHLHQTSSDNGQFIYP